MPIGKNTQLIRLLEKAEEISNSQIKYQRMLCLLTAIFTYKDRGWHGYTIKTWEESLMEVLDTLSDREKRVIKNRFGLEDGIPQTLEQVGKQHGVNRERIRQIEAKALRKLRHPSRRRVLLGESWQMAREEARESGQKFFNEVQATRIEKRKWLRKGGVEGKISDPGLVEELDMPTRVSNSLRRGGFRQISDLINFGGDNFKDLLKVKNIGGRSLRMIKEALEKRKNEQLH